MKEKRKALRKRAAVPAVISSEDGSILAHITVRDISVTGARIAFLNEPMDLDNFVFKGSNGSVVRHAKIIWRRGREAGVEFT